MKDQYEGKTLDISISNYSDANFEAVEEFKLASYPS